MEINNQKIQRIRVENIKGIREIEIFPDSTFNEISGDNAQGKSSILDSILMTFAGKKYIPDSVVRHGEKKGIIEIETEDLNLCLKVKATGSSLKIRPKSGAKAGQKDLNELFNKVGFDPLEFSRLKLNEKVNMIREILGEEFNAKFDLLAESEKSNYGERRLRGREITAIGDLTLPPEVIAVSISGLIEKLKSSQFKNDALNVLREDKASLDLDVEQFRALYSETNISLKNIDSRLENSLVINARLKEDTIDEINALQRKIKELDNEADGFEARAKKEKEAFSKELKSIEKNASEPKDEVEKIKKQIDAFELIDTAPIERDIEEAEGINQKARDYAEAVEDIEKKQDLQKEYDNLTDIIESIRDERLSMIEESPLPIKGLSFDFDGIYLYNETLDEDTPIEELSSAEKLLISTKIASSMNPKLRVITIRDGALLDTATMNTIKQYAKENDLQLWVETVKENNDAIIIRDGVMVN